MLRDTNRPAPELEILSHSASSQRQSPTLDYKPDARTNTPIAQLAIYALALTRLVPRLKLFDIKCAWFNEDEYCEFFPRTLFVNPPKNS